MSSSNNRLTVLGAKAQVRRFKHSPWEKALTARHGELLENSPGRFACQFETESPPLELLKRLSRRWPGLTFLLDYEAETQRTKGLAKAVAGKLEHCEFNY